MRRIQSQNVRHKIIHSVVEYLQDQGFSAIWANGPGFEAPNPVRWDEKDKGIVPDIVGEHSGSVYVFEIETANQLDPQQVEDRWRLLSVHAKRFQGKFYLVIPEPNAEVVQEVVDALDIQPEILKLRGVEDE